MTYGQGVIHAKSSKQKLNVKSSTECEIVGTSEYCPYNIWHMMFMEAQGYPLHKIFYFKTIKVQSEWNKTVETHAREIRGMCTYDIFLLKTE